MAVEIPRPIHRWTAVKLEHLDAYLQAYVTATKRWGERYYIDAFAGCGDCVLMENQMPVEGSALRALSTVPPFSGYYFVEADQRSVEHLERRTSAKDIPNVHVLCGDCNELIPKEVLPKLPRNAPSFAFLDPTGLQLQWRTVEALARHRSIGDYKMELLIVYPYDMAINRQFFLPRPPTRALTLFYGNNEWEAEFQDSRRLREGSPARRERFVNLYVGNLKSLAYRYVDVYGPLRDRGRPLYHVIFAGDHPVGAKIMRDVWSKSRPIPGEMWYRPLRRPAPKS